MIPFFTVSCGGGSGGTGGETGGGGGSPAPNISGDLNVQFSGEEGGVRRVEVSGNTIHYLNAITGDPITDRTSVDWTGVREYRWSNDRIGVQTFHNGELTLREFVDNIAESFVIMTGYFAESDDRLPLSVDFEAGGANVSNIPSGLYRYNGYGYSNPRRNSALGLGDFTMNVNFDNASGTFNYLDYDEWVSLIGSFVINKQNGNFAGNDLQIVVIDPEHNLKFEDKATIYGSFHNRGATGVSGIFYDNRDKVYGGAFAGARTDLRPDE